jgi:DNA-binding transcriptional regulator YiaG
MARTYKSVFKIQPKVGTDLGTAADMEHSAGEAFLDSIENLLKELDTTTLGKQLISEVVAAGKDVIIFNSTKDQGSAAKPYPGTVTNEMQRFVQLRQIPERALKKLKTENQQFVAPEAAFYAAEVHAVIEKSKVVRSVLAAILGLSIDQLDDVERGRRAFTDQQYHRFAMFMYPHLTPGAGCTVSYRFEAAQALQDPNDSELIIFAHELIHAWRMVKGMRIFEGGWEEEAMTVGLPPFSNMAITENKLRVALNMGLRTKYIARCTTGHYQVVTGFEGGKGVWPEHLKKWEKWKEDNPELAKKPVVITPRSVFKRG